MAYQFCCPQGHILQGELVTVGQIMRCPMCGSEFHVPPPDAGATISEGFTQGPGMWSTPAAPTGYSMPVPEKFPAGGYPPPPNPAFVAPGAMQGMPQPQVIPGGPFAPQGFPAPQYGATGVAGVQPPAPKPPAPPPPAPPAGTGDGQKFDLGFDPFAKAALPFDLPGHGEADAGGNAATAPPPSSSAFLAGPSQIGPPPVGPSPVSPFPSPPISSGPAPQFPAPEIKPTNSTSSASGDDFLAGPPPLGEAPAETAPPPKMLHIRCPSGHVVKAPSDLLGKLGRCPACKKTFELRYENSLEFKRRTEKILHRDENEAGRAWLGWIFVAAFLVFVALVGAVLILGR
jgi:hypothetical protein